MSKKKDVFSLGDGGGKEASPFASLMALKDSLPKGDAPKEEGPSAGETASQATLPKKVWLRVERKGRGGKLVTLVEGFPEGELKGLLKKIKSSLGSGGTAEGSLLLLQGDLRERLRRLFESWGIKEIVG